MTLLEYKRMKELTQSVNIEDRILATKDSLITNNLLQILINDENWLVRLNAIWSKNIEDETLLERMIKEKNEIVLRQINHELSFRKIIKEIKGERVICQ